MPPAFRVSSAVRATAPPPIPLAFGWSQAYRPDRNGGRKLINLSQGVPGAPPDASFVTALAETIRDPMSHKYGQILGEDTLREALADEYKDVYSKGVEGWGGKDGAGVNASDVGVVAGANMAFMSTIQTLAEAGDEIILPTPYYFNNAMVLSLLNLVTVPLPTAPPSFLPSVADARKLITPKTRAIVLITPNNPTGAIASPELIQDFADLATEHKIALILDSTYADFVPPVPSRSSSNPSLSRGKPHHLFSTPAWRSSIISLFSFSKSYGLPGHRLGCLVADPAFLAQVAVVLDCMQINPPRPSQIAIAPLLPSLRPKLIATAQRYVSLLTIFAEEVLPACPGWTPLSRGGLLLFRAASVSRVPVALGSAGAGGEVWGCDPPRGVFHASCR